MKRKLALAVGASIIVLVVALAGYYWYRLSKIDTSWVSDVNEMLQNAKPHPNGTEYSNPNAMLSYCRTYLYENGTKKLIEFGGLGANSNNPVSTYLNNLLIKANMQLQSNGSITSNFLDRVLASDKVVQITYRVPVMQFGDQYKFYMGYFVLEDSLNKDLSGKFIAGEVEKNGYSLWAISR